MLTIEDDEVSKSKKSSLNLKNLFSSTSGIDPLSDIIRKEAKSIVHSRFKKKSSKDKIKHKPWKLEEEWFDFVNEASERVIKNFVNSTLESFLNAKLFNVFQCIGSAGSVYTLLAPYFFSFGLFKKDRAFARECLSNLLGKKYDLKKVNTKVALFTDTFQETNGVALTLRMQLKLAKKHYKDMEIITCNSKPGPEGTAVFNPLGTFDLPEYQGLKLYYPSFLSMLEYCYNRGFNLICSSTPGPVGLCALGIAKVLNIPIHGTYHTAFPKYASELTGDFDMEELTWKYMLWYYSHMDIVYSPSKATAKELASRGLDKHKIKVYPRGIDIERFSPIKRNGFWTKYSGIKSESTKLLYVGRVSKEKNLDVLCKAYKELIKVRPDVQLIVVGQGPYLSEMQERLKATKALFTGWLYEEDLAQAYASSDVFVFPSATDTFGNVILEAQASGLPVIATDQGGPKENLIVDQTGLLVPANDSMAFYSAILHLISNPDLIEEMKLKARDYMEKRSIEAAFLKSWDMYEKNRFENPVY
jgi:glycosyltransferase involved in cell wall biosynthesis